MNALLLPLMRQQLQSTTSGVVAAEGAGAQAQPGNPIVSIIMFAGLIFLMYFVMIRPQRKKEKDQKAMQSALEKGDKIMTIGGIIGKVVGVKDNTVVIQVEEGMKIEFAKDAINSVLQKKNAPSTPQKEEKKGDSKPAEIASSKDEAPKSNPESK